ncbi:MAG: hypothetical protein ACM3X4_01235 [Ignavibacteriales bacterium]
MASEGMVWQYYLVVYLDLLGQSESLRRIGSIPSNPSETDEFIQQVKDSLGKVLLVRDAFTEFFKHVESYEPDVSLVKPEHREEFIAAQRTRVISYSISDSLVIAVPLTGDDEFCTAMNGVRSTLLALCGLGLFLLSHGIPLRAGVEVGLATQIGEHEIYGPALLTAFDLESKEAEYPRFVVGHELMEYLNYVANQEPATRLGTVARETAKKCRNLIVRADGQFMLDFLGKAVRDQFDDRLSTKAFWDAFSYVRGQLDKFTKEGLTKLSCRYSRLAGYFDANKCHWE